MKRVSHFRDLSGRALSGCAFLIDRYRDDLPWSASDTETWVGVVDKIGNARLIRGEVAWYTDVWTSESGCVYLTSERSLIIGTPGTSSGAGAYQWSTLALPFRAWGGWGFSDQLFYAWGFDGRQQQVARIAAGAITTTVVPGPVVSMSGTSPDLLYVAGETGLLARWDGHAFVQVSVQETASFNRVVVLSEHEIYASTRNGAVWHGSVHGLSRMPAAIAGGAMGVTKFAGALYAASETDGLRKLDGTQWVDAKAPQAIRKVWGDRTLFALGDQHLIETSDAKDYNVIALASLHSVFDPVVLTGASRLWLAS